VLQWQVIEEEIHDVVLCAEELRLLRSRQTTIGRASIGDFRHCFEDSDMEERAIKSGAFTSDRDTYQYGLSRMIVRPWRREKLRQPGTYTRLPATRGIVPLHRADPACGGGNFHCICYREMKKLEQRRTAARSRGLWSGHHGHGECAAV